MTTARPTSLWRRLYFTRLRDAARGRFDASLDWRRVIAEADLPPEIAEVVRIGVRATRLWRSEKVDLARELVAHFQDGLETGRLPQQLISAFGDARLAAKLIRRAKRRNRPLARQFLRLTSFAFVAVACVYLIAGVYFLSGTPSIEVDYFERINARALAVPRDQSAWPLYREALSEMNLRFARSDAESLSADLASSESIAKLRAAGRRESLGLPVAARPQSFAPEDRTVFTGLLPDDPYFAPQAGSERMEGLVSSALMPHVELLRKASELLSADCRRATREGDSKTAFEDVFAQLGIARHMQQPPILWSAYSAQKPLNDAYNSIWFVLNGRSDLWSDEQLAILAHQVARTEIDWRQGLEGDRIAFYDALQRTYSDNGHGDGRMTAEGMKLFAAFQPLTTSRPALALLALPATNLIVASRQEMAATYDRYFDEIARQLDQPLWENSGTSADQPLRSEMATKWRSYRYYLARLFLSSGNTIKSSAESTSGRQEGVSIGIALELYRRQQGSWPESLDQLSPRWLPTVPVDRVTGGALRYRLFDGQPVIYSVGTDLDDDFGRPAVKSEDVTNAVSDSPYASTWSGDGDWVIWSIAAPRDAPR
jgi:hypothetical protein